MAELSEKLGVRLTVDNFVQSHTPFQGYVEELRDKNVLVTGGEGDKCRMVAERSVFHFYISVRLDSGSGLLSHSTSMIVPSPFRLELSFLSL